MNKQPMNQAFLLTGGNLGDRVALLEEARKQIASRCGRVLAASPLYETAAWGKTDQPAFLNQALKISSSLDAPALIKRLLAIEKDMGRIREEKNGPRLIDIDLIFFNDLVLDQPGIQVPHPRLQDRRFVLVPLAAIAPDKKHPVLHQTVSELLANCPDHLPVHRYD